MLFTKIHENPCIFVKVIVKKSVAPFLSGHGVRVTSTCRDLKSVVCNLHKRMYKWCFVAFYLYDNNSEFTWFFCLHIQIFVDQLIESGSNIYSWCCVLCRVSRHVQLLCDVEQLAVAVMQPVRVYWLLRLLSLQSMSMHRLSSRSP